MSEPRRKGLGRQQRRRVRDGLGPHGGGKGKSGAGQSLGARTTTRILVAAGTYVAQDLRDADGLLRPALRRAALSLALGSRSQARRLGNAYLRLDPPQPRLETTSIGPVRPSSSPLMLTEETHSDGPSQSAHTAEGVEPGDQPSLQWCSEHMPRRR
jgi:hypothetical protein